MRLRRSWLFFIIAIPILTTPLLLHAQTDGESDDTPYHLVPFVLPDADVGGLAPATWVQTQPGVFTREASGGDLTTLIHVATPNSTLDEIVRPFFSVLDIDALPDAAEAEIYEAETLSWRIYAFEIALDIPDAETDALSVDLAVAQDQSGAYLVALQTQPDERDALRQAVFFPALEAFALPMNQLSQAADAFNFVEVAIPEYNVTTVIPAHWRGGGPGVFTRANIAQDGTTLLIQTSPDLSPVAFGGLLVFRFGFDEADLRDGDSYTSEAREWAISTLTIDDGITSAVLQVALAEDADATYLVVLLTSVRDAERLREAILLPVLDNIVYTG